MLKHMVSGADVPFGVSMMIDDQTRLGVHISQNLKFLGCQ